jgi:hypothetical protein
MTYTIYRENSETHQINVIQTYSTYAEARFHLNEVVLDHLEKTYKQPETDSKFIERDEQLKDAAYIVGHYYLKISHQFPNRIYVGQKAKRVVAGYLRNSEEVEFKEVLWFGILELKFSSNDVAVDIDSTTRKQTSQVLQQHGEQIKMIDELKRTLASKRERNLKVDKEGNMLSNVAKKFVDPSAFAKELTDYVRIKRQADPDCNDSSDGE